MLESNVFRLLMMVLAVIVVGMLVTLTFSSLPDITMVIDSFFGNRLQKY